MLVSLVIKNITCHSVIEYSYTRGPSTNKFSIIFSKKIWRIKNNVYLCNPKRKREHSSAGLEHLPYKQGVTGSNPVAPTKKETVLSKIYSEVDRSPRGEGRQKRHGSIAQLV